LSNFGISEGNLVGMIGQKGECNMGSLVNLDRSDRSKVAKNDTGYWLEDDIGVA
jgi:hypothetical protein